MKSEQIQVEAGRFSEFGPWLTAQAGTKVQKISVNAGFTCPNRDGRVGTGGCTYCNNQTFNPAYCSRPLSVREQLEEGKRFFGKKYPQMKYLAYFQAYTNTYGTVDNLRRKYEEALDVEDVVGLVIGTRPDCMPEALADYLERLNRQCFLLVEFGIESTDDEVLRRVNRGHDFACTRRAVETTASRGILTGGHVILGLPGTVGLPGYLHREAERLNALPLSTLKIHQLQLIRGTRMAQEYAERPEDFHLFTADEYIDYVLRFVGMLRSDIMIERLVSQSPAGLLAVPGWGLKNYEFMERVRQRAIRIRKNEDGI